MSGLPTGEALRIIRAFGYFSHLANIAEDQHHIRRTRAYAMAEAPPRRGTMAYALARARRTPASRASSSQALLRPRAVRPGADRASDRGAAQEHRSTARWRSPACSTSATASSSRRRSWPPTAGALRRNVLTLWQTSLLRRTRLRVHRRGRQRAGLLRPHLPRALPELLRRPRGRSALDPAWQDSTCRPSCAWAAGSAATATAIRSSPPR